MVERAVEGNLNKGIRAYSGFKYHIFGATGSIPNDPVQVQNHTKSSNNFFGT